MQPEGGAGKVRELWEKAPLLSSSGIGITSAVTLDRDFAPAATLLLEAQRDTSTSRILCAHTRAVLTTHRSVLGCPAAGLGVLSSHIANCQAVPNGPPASSSVSAPQGLMQTPSGAPGLGPGPSCRGSTPSALPPLEQGAGTLVREPWGAAPALLGRLRSHH